MRAHRAPKICTFIPVVVIFSSTKDQYLVCLHYIVLHGMLEAVYSEINQILPEAPLSQAGDRRGFSQFLQDLTGSQLENLELPGPAPSIVYKCRNGNIDRKISPVHAYACPHEAEGNSETGCAWCIERNESSSLVGKESWCRLGIFCLECERQPSIFSRGETSRGTGEERGQPSFGVLSMDRMRAGQSVGPRG